MVAIFVSNGTLSCLSPFVSFASTFSLKTSSLCYVIFELNMTTMLSYIVCEYFVLLLPND